MSWPFFMPWPMMLSCAGPGPHARDTSRFIDKDYGLRMELWSPVLMDPWP